MSAYLGNKKVNRSLRKLLNNGDLEEAIPFYETYGYSGRNKRYYFKMNRSAINYYRSKDAHAINVAVLFDFTCKYSMPLYEYINGLSQQPDFINNPKQKKFVNLLYLRTRLGVGESQYGNVSSLKLYVLDKASKEINKNSDVNFKYKLEVEKGICVGVTFYGIVKKGNIVLPDEKKVEEAEENQEEKFFELTEKLGLSNKDAFKLYNVAAGSYKRLKEVADSYILIKNSNIVSLPPIMIFFEETLKVIVAKEK